MSVTPTVDYVAQAEALIRAYCGWHIAPSVDETLIVDGSGAWALTLPTLYVTAITSVTENGVALVENDDYTWSQAGVLRRASWAGDWAWTPGGWTTAYRAVAVELSHGYDTMPLEVTGVVQAIAGRLAANPTGLEQQTVGPFTDKYATGSSTGAAAFGDAAAAALAPYRLPPRP